MKMVFVRVPVVHGESGMAELNQLLASGRVLSVSREFVSDGNGSAWCFCLSVAKGPEKKEKSPRKGGRTDYKEILSPEDFTIFAALRDLRLELAKADGAKAYAVFDNKQLARMVTDRVTTKVALANIPGVGEKRLERYAEPFLQLLRREFAKLEPPGPAASADPADPVDGDLFEAGAD